MKNICLPVILLFAANGVIGQQIYTNVDLTLTYTFETLSDSSISEKRVETLDTAGNELLGEIWDWNQEFDSWEGSGRWEYGYDTTGQAITYLGYWWDPGTGDWNIRRSDTLIYDPDGNVEEEIEMTWDQALQDWRYYYRSVWEYDSAGNRILSEGYSWKEEGWAISSRHENSYDSAGNIVLDYFYLWDGELQQLLLSSGWKYERTYDSIGNTILFFGYSWDADLEEWIKAAGEKREYSYDDQGRDTLLIWYDWDQETDEWIPSYRSETEYEPGGAFVFHRDSRWDPGTASWIKEFESKSYSDPTGQLLWIEISFEWNPDLEQFDQLQKVFYYRDCSYYIADNHAICNGETFFREGEYLEAGVSSFEFLQGTDGRDSITEFCLDIFPNPVTVEIDGETMVHENQVDEYRVSWSSWLTFTWSVENGTILSYPYDQSVEIQWGNKGDGVLYGIGEDPNGCLTDTASLQVSVSVVGIDRTENPEILVYPNPAKENIIIQTGVTIWTEGCRLRVINPAGAVVLETSLDSPRHELKLPPGTVPGFFTLQITSPGGTIMGTRKIVVE